MDNIVGKDHYAERDGLKLYLWEKFNPDEEAKFAGSGRVVLLVHGAMISSRPLYDLQVAGKDYSMMDYLAREGFDVFALDIAGFGRSDKPADGGVNATADINAAIDYIAKARSVSQVNLLGWSWGTRTTPLFTSKHPEKVRRLILFAPSYRGRRMTAQERAQREAMAALAYQPNTAERLRGWLIPEVTDLEVRDAFLKEALATDPQSPTGYFRDFGVTTYDPAQLTMPVMLLYGEFEESADKREDLHTLFASLGTMHKRWVVLPGGGHTIHLEEGHLRVCYEIAKFFGAPD
jgi:pimeloyl-ACP methyl ester carboxylesterase